MSREAQIKEIHDSQTNIVENNAKNIIHRRRKYQLWEHRKNIYCESNRWVQKTGVGIHRCYTLQTSKPLILTGEEEKI